MLVLCVSSNAVGSVQVFRDCRVCVCHQALLVLCMPSVGCVYAIKHSWFCVDLQALSVMGGSPSAVGSVRVTKRCRFCAGHQASAVLCRFALRVVADEEVSQFLEDLIRYKALNEIVQRKIVQGTDIVSKLKL
ncbi:hypothetical protein NDU88_001249 [Pleurodeles waltl]|uniref:Uncharacterized protein n=1 Tax=Pleurodeles waltl TaxID=8319 RepID=A0AAV7Q985_PLEWA|nr:hypothetical protein NDU88_001249 [Pleurodeles waltl]